MEEKSEEIIIPAPSVHEKQEELFPEGSSIKEEEKDRTEDARADSTPTSFSNSSTVGADLNGHDDAPEDEAKEDAPKVFAVTCGLLRAKLHHEKFMCPGIHQPCIEYEGEFYSPKQFTVVSAKDKQKDWKGSIKIDRMPLRTLMERKQLDFFLHETFCSGKCASKNYRPSLRDSSDLNDWLASTSSNDGPSNVDLGSESQRNLENYIKSSFGLDPSGVAISGQTPPMKTELSLPSPTSQRQSLLANVDFLAALQRSCIPTSPSIVPDPDPTSTTRMSTDELLFQKPFQFWQAVYHLGIFPEIVSEFCKQMEEFKILFLNRPDLRPKVSEKLSEIVKTMEMSDSIKRILQTKRLMTKAETDILGSEIEELKKRAEEQKKRQQEAKRKADIFDQLFAMSAKSPKLS